MRNNHFLYPGEEAYKSGREVLIRFKDCDIGGDLTILTIE
jgi:hypothetical protein